VLDIEKQARTVEIEAEIEAEAAVGLLPGYSADVEVIIAERERVLRVPTEAIFDSTRTLVLDPNSGLLEQREVQTGLANWEYTEITGGLGRGERVVLSLDREGVAAGVAAREE
jgi:HlyD family secretion protein